jgi:nicotinate-nucleotide pyrophosphorylase (carboxylating)
MRHGARSLHIDPLTRLVRAALREDVGPADITTELTVPADARCRATLLAKQDGVLSGIRPFRRVFGELRADLEDWSGRDDGDALAAGQSAVTFTGNTRAVLTGERTALNFVQRLSGIATLARAFVRAVDGLDVRILDTRKTTPGLRRLEKQAVAHGGARNHRHALYDGVLIKDNHIVAAGGVTAAIEKARAGVHHLMKIEVEVKSLDELGEALNARADVILLDNMDLDTMRQAVARGKGRGVLFEASGGVRLETVRAIAETGVNFISAGALTHSAPALDLSLELEL